MLSEKLLGLARSRSLPRWRADVFTRRLRNDAASAVTASDEAGRDVVLWADTFDNYFEPENLRAARRVLRAAGYNVIVARAAQGDAQPFRPLCCGRTFLASGLVDQAKAEARRTIAALAPYVARGVPVVGLEPSCLLTMRDEFLVMGLGEAAEQLAGQAMLFEEFLAREHQQGRLSLKLSALPHKRALLHGHCHQKAFDAVHPIQTVLSLIPDLKVELIESSCCGMAGSFGYEASHQTVSMAMAEASLLPAVRAAGANDLIVADGTSCRHQIHDGAQRDAVHVARVLEAALLDAR
jgi:Fe-S oxidoreductase